jgi:drug/metabolite transporter (DMT)-like permease
MTRAHANGLLLLAALMWGSGNVAQQQLLSAMGPLMANGLRCLIAFACIAPLVLLVKAPKRRLSLDGWMLLLSSALAFTLATGANQASFAFTTVTANGVLVNTCMVITPFVGLMLFRSKPSPFIWPACVAAFAGTTVLSGGGIFSFGIGEILCLFAAVCYALWMVLLNQFVSHYGRAAMASSVQFIVAGAISTSLAVASELNSAIQIINSLDILLVAGVFGTAAGYFLMTLAQSKASANETAIISSLEAVFAGIAGFIILGERLTANSYLGLAIIASAIIISQLPPEILHRKRVARVVLSPNRISQTAKPQHLYRL